MIRANHPPETAPRTKVGELASHLDLPHACREIVRRALDFCGQKANTLSHEAIVAALRQGHPSIHDYFRYGLAKEIGSYLGHVGANVKAVYFVEPEVTPEEVIEAPASLTRDLALIAWVDGQKDGLTALAQAIDAALLAEYRTLLGAAAESQYSLLKVDVVDDRDVQERVGSGALLASVYTRPIQVWSRFVIHLDAEHCGQCLICSSVCPYGAISISPGVTAAKIDLEKCQFCGLCYSACPAGAIELAYYDLVSLARDVQRSVRTNGFKALALTCRGSTPTAQEIEDILGTPGFVPVCVPCVGRIPPEFFLKALTLGIERIAVLPCQDDHCRFEDGSRIARNRSLLLQSMLRGLGYDPAALIFREAKGPVATVDADLCTGCGTCIGVCPYEAIHAEIPDGRVLPVAQVDPARCQGCGACAASCPVRAIEMSQFTGPQIISRITAALARPHNGDPRVLGFRCNWCSYGDADLPFDNLHYTSQNIEVIRVPCVGRIDPFYVLWAFINGADGVFLGGCPPDDCRYVSGSSQAESRIARLGDLLQAHGFDSRRLRLEWLRRDSPEALGDALRSFAAQVEKLGRSQIP